METKVIEIEWTDLLKRLKHHRTRLSISKEEMKDYIKEKYGKTFWTLTNDQIVEIGTALGKCQDKYDILF
ncbi:hypothetical protein [Geminocystis sp. NIES-3709]|uniref:hypothetical protein n=1 Tax=Geminocystis sp. NIES-3709 TaxID=1617448 RepID=UPI000826CDDF|nr:hypothetical protein [Geminocystis sp. NIES-3709]